MPYFSTRLRDRGVPLFRIKERLGHKSMARVEAAGSYGFHYAFSDLADLVYLAAKSAYIYTVIEESHIRQVAQRLGQAANAEQVILFGSHARGMATEYSDVDLLVVAESTLPRFKRSRALYRLLRPYPFGMDLVVYTPEEIEKGRQTPFSFVATVLREGKTVYVRPH